MPAKAKVPEVNLDHVLEEVAKEKGVEKQALVETIEAAILKAAQNTFGLNRELEARYNPDKGHVELFQFMTGVKWTHIPYKGVAPALTDVVAGNLQVLISTIPACLQFIKSGQVKALAVPSLQRAPALPQVPLANEAVPGLVGELWVAMYAPKGTPAMIVNRLNAETRKALEDPVVREKLLALGLEPAPTTPAQLAKLTADGNAAVKKIIKDAGIKAE